jgi:hypothetical protein
MQFHREVNTNNGLNRDPEDDNPEYTKRKKRNKPKIQAIDELFPAHLYITEEGRQLFRAHVHLVAYINK